MSGTDPALSPTLTLATRGPLFDCYAALLGRLELGFPASQFARVYLPAKPSAKTWQRAFVALPAVGICWLGLKPDERSGRMLRGGSDWLLFFACKNALAANLLTGDVKGLGVLGLAGLAAALLHGWTVPDLGAWTVTSVDNAALQEFVDDDVGVAAIQASCGLTVIDDAAAAALPEFLRFGATWDLPPIVGETVQDVRPT